jgi:putative transposase
MAYIEQNPVRAKMVRRAWRYPWSSAVAHCNVEDELGLLDMDKWQELLGDNDWSESLTAGIDTDELDLLRLHVSRGRPLGSDKFISRLEARLGKRLRALPVGRPKKRKKATVAKKTKKRKKVIVAKKTVGGPKKRKKATVAKKKSKRVNR